MSLLPEGSSEVGVVLCSGNGQSTGQGGSAQGRGEPGREPGCGLDTTGSQGQQAGMVPARPAGRGAHPRSTRAWLTRG